MSRQVFLVFYGEEKWKKKADHPGDRERPPGPTLPPSAPGAAAHGAHGDFKPHESPRIMAMPLMVLAGLALLGGLLNLPFRAPRTSSTGSSRCSATTSTT